MLVQTEEGQCYYEDESIHDMMVAVVDRTENYVDSGLEPLVAEESAMFDIYADQMLVKQGLDADIIYPDIVWGPN